MSDVYMHINEPCLLNGQSPYHHITFIFVSCNFFGFKPIFLQMVTVAKKLKDTYSLEGKL